MPRPLRPECALILEGYREVLIAKGLAEIKNWCRPDPIGPMDPALYRRIGKDEGPVWPETDPDPIVRNTDPVPEDKTPPKAINQIVDALLDAGWTAIRTGYSLGYRRKTSIGQYRKAETWGVYTAEHPDTGMKIQAVYERNPETKSGAWSWSSITVSGPGRPAFSALSITLAREWIAARGMMDDLWYRRILRDSRAKTERAKTAARARPKASGEHGG